MSTPRFQRATENAADNLRAILNILFYIFVFVIFAPAAFACFLHGDAFAGMVLSACAFSGPVLAPNG
jgi:hypothetical protein